MTRAGRARPLSAPQVRKHAGRRLAVLAAAIAVPAMAAPGDWGLSVPTGPEGVVPMPFERPGESFPGSAFYYLVDQPYLPAAADTPPADETRFALPRPSSGGIDPGPSAQALRFAGSTTDRLRAQQCLTMAIYYEAASEADAGQRAVAQVVLNRLAHPAYPDTVCGVVFQGSDRSTGCQFTFTCDGSLKRKPARMWWDRAATVARAALSGAVYAPVGLATHYHTVQIHPYWADSLDHVDTIGAHRFYRWQGAAGRPRAFNDRYLGGEPLPAPHRPHGFASTETDPIDLAAAHEAIPTAAAPTMAAAPPVLEAGEALAREATAAAGQVRPEYARSGQWIRQPQDIGPTHLTVRPER